MSRHLPSPVERPAWGDAAFLRSLFESVGGNVEVTERELAFEAASAAQWFADQEERHPAWRASRRALEPFPDAWSEVRRKSIAALEAANTGTDRMRVVSRFFVTHARW